MKQSILLILIAGFLLISCGRQKTKESKTNQSSDEKQITTLAFYASVESDSIFKKNILEENEAALKSYEEIVKDPIQRNIYISQQLNHIDSLKKELKEKSIYLLIRDTLIGVSSNYFAKKLANLKTNPELHSDTDSLIRWWREIQITRISGNFKMMNIVRKYHYQLLFMSQKHTIIHKGIAAGIFAMSAIFYNKNRDKAFVQTTFVCGGLCGDGKDIYLAKRNGKWFIYQNVENWVS